MVFIKRQKEDTKDKLALNSEAAVGRKEKKKSKGGPFDKTLDVKFLHMPICA